LFYRIPYQWCVPIGMLVDQVVYSCFFLCVHTAAVLACLGTALLLSGHMHVSWQHIDLGWVIDVKWFGL
jgi:hypothetical protein